MAARPILRVGLTGGIASGKTTVGGLLAEHGAYVLDEANGAVLTVRTDRLVLATGGSVWVGHLPISHGSWSGGDADLLWPLSPIFIRSVLIPIFASPRAFLMLSIAAGTLPRRMRTAERKKRAMAHSGSIAKAFSTLAAVGSILFHRGKWKMRTV